MNKQLSAYNIYWAIAIPTKGIATKKEAKKFAKQGWSRIHFTTNEKKVSVFLRHSGNLDMLKSKCKIDGKEKEYRVVFITDKQFGMIKNWDYMSIATSTQKQNMITI